MFTGIVEELGKIGSVSVSGKSAVLKVECSAVLADSKIGDSIAVNGVCLTATSIDSKSFTADISYETLERSSMKGIKRGDTVNLERALTLSTRLGGHLVSGHVDGLGKVEKIAMRDNAWVLTVRYPEELDKYIAEKGSVTVDGISLTVAKNTGFTFDVAVIPHTFENTVLKQRAAGAFVNLEVDIVSRYLEKLLKNSEKADTLADNLRKLDIDMF